MPPISRYEGKPCFTCDGKYTYRARAGRTCPYKGMVLPLPDDMPLIECDTCGDLLFGETLAREMDAVLEEKYREVRCVECCVCGRAYKRAVPDSYTQGCGCASNSKDDVVVYANYGSTFDGSVFRVEGLPKPGFTVVPEKIIDLDPICDWCICGWLFDGRARYVWEFLHNEYDVHQEKRIAIGIAIGRACAVFPARTGPIAAHDVTKAHIRAVDS